MGTLITKLAQAVFMYKGITSKHGERGKIDIKLRSEKSEG
jgi:hypothetical protein